MQVQVLRPEATTEALRDRAEGRQRNGVVRLRHFDEGIITTMGGVIDVEKKQGFIEICGVDGPPGSPIGKDCCSLKVPIVFSNPEDIYSQAQMPMVIVKRESIHPNLTRWMPGQLQYRTPAYNARKVFYATGTSYAKVGFDYMEQRQMAIPYDFNYTITIIARYRGGALDAYGNKISNKAGADDIFDHIFRIYQPHSVVKLIDSIGDERTYEVEMESIGNIDSLPGVSERVIGFSFSLLVMGELDAAPVETYATLTSAPRISETLFTEE